MSAFLDLSQQKFGRLTVLSQGETKVYPSGQKHPTWLCKCDCGRIVQVVSGQLVSGGTKSCGCYRSDMNRIRRRTTHDMSNSRLYRIFYGMISRCENPNTKYFNLYGGKGIRVCEAWRTNFEAFAEWAVSNGYDDTLSIDRIDNALGYCPSNCRWATAKEQIHNRDYSPRKRVKQISLDGDVVAEYPSIEEAASAVGVKGPNISKCVRHRGKTSAGFRWEYA